MRIHMKNILAGLGTMAILVVALIVGISSFANFGNVDNSNNIDNIYNDTDYASSAKDCGYLDTWNLGLSNFGFGMTTDDTSVYIVDNGVVKKYSDNGKLEQTFVSGKLSPSSSPRSIVVDKLGNVYVTDKPSIKESKIVVFDLNGNYLKDIKHTDFVNISHLGIFYMNTTDFYLLVTTDSNKGDVISLKNANINSPIFTSMNSPKGSSPTDMAVSKDGYMYLVDQNIDIQKFKLENSGKGTYINTYFGGPSDAENKFKYIRDIFVEGGNIYVVDNQNNDSLVKVFDSNFNYLYKFELLGNANANALVSLNDKIFVFDNSNKNILTYSKEYCGLLTVIKNYRVNNDSDTKAEDFNFGLRFNDFDNGYNFKLDDDNDPALSNKASFYLSDYIFDLFEEKTREIYTTTVSCVDSSGNVLINGGDNIHLDFGNKKGLNITCTFVNSPVSYGPGVLNDREFP